MNIVVLITARDTTQAKRIAQALIREKHVACVNIMAGARSLFWWDGKVDAAKETLLIVKSRKQCFPAIVRTVKKWHSYEVPEIIALPIVAGEKKYLTWLADSCKA